MVNLCNYCSRRDRCYKLIKLVAAVLREVKNDPEIKMSVEVAVERCAIFKPLKQINRALEHICYSCQNSGNCSLWEQVSEIDEDFIKEAFKYEPEVQSVGVAVDCCKLYQPKR